MTSATTLSHRAPEQSLRRARWCVWVGITVTAASIPLLTASLYVPLLALVGWLVTAWRLTREVRHHHAATLHLGLKRSFRFVDLQIPHRTQGGVPVPPVRWWTPEWVPYEVVKRSEPSSQGPTEVQRKILRVPPAWLAVLDQQRLWVQRHAPARWHVLTAWWNSWYLKPLLERRHPGGTLTQAAIDDAAQACEVELRIAISLAGQPALWSRRLGLGDECDAYDDLGRRLAALADPLTKPGEGQCPVTPAPAFPVYCLPVFDSLFVGRGFICETKHTQRMEDLKLHNMSEVTSHPEEQGDPRIYGTGHDDVGDLFMEETQFNQMAGIFGSTGVGKTRYAEVLLVQVIRFGLPLLIIDPKGDQLLTNRIAEECRRQGRGHQFQYFCLAAPQNQRTWRYLARYNPCYTYTDPAELAARIASVLPATSDPFWTNTAKAMIENCVTLVHWSNWYLRFISRRADGSLPDKESQEVPRVLLAMQWARHHPDATPAQANAAVGAILDQLRDPVWTPQRSDERDVVALLTTTSLEGVPLYSPIEWIPTVRHVSEYEIDNTVAFLGWILRIFFPHLYLGSHKMAAPAFPRLASNQEIVSKSGRGEELSMWSLYQMHRLHPLEVRYEPNADVGPDQQRWLAFYDHFVPERDGDTYELRRMFQQLRRNLEAHYSDATKERQKFLEYATTLQSAIKPILGERSRIMCAIDSDIIWEQMIAHKQVVYCALGSMIDDNGSTSCAKLIIQDIAAYFGRRYQYQGGTPEPVYLFADEVSSFINGPFINLLNKCRGVGLRAIIAGQTRADLAKQLGKEGAQQAMGNLNTVIQLRSPEAVDAREFAERTGEARIIQETRNVSITPGIAHSGNTLINNYSSSESHGYSQQTVKRIPVDAILALPRGQAFIHAKGQIFLVAQGLLDDPRTNIYEEIGMHCGVMLDPVVPSPRPLPAELRRLARGSALTQSPSGIPPAAGRPGSDLAVMADEGAQAGADESADTGDRSGAEGASNQPVRIAAAGSPARPHDNGTVFSLRDAALADEDTPPPFSRPG